MRLHAKMTQDEIRDALTRDALYTWGPERLEALKGSLDQAARSIWTVLQVELAPLSEEPDFPIATSPSAAEG